MSDDRPRVILHLDMDAFYAAIEVRENPSLAGRPLIIGHRGRRGVVSTCSYEARRFGVRSAMPSVTAERLCPEAIWLPGRMALYVQVSREIRTILDAFSPLVEPLSIDEAFLDLTGIAGGLAGGADTALRIKVRIREAQQLTASVGVAPNKFLAKLASDMEKPDGLVVIALADLPDRLWPLPVERLWGVGDKTAQRLHAGGIDTVRALLECDEARLRALVGPSLCTHLRALARGDDPRPVRSARDRKSISEERTYADDLTDPAAIDRAFIERADGVSRVLRQKRLLARTVQIKVRTGDFTTWTRSHTLPAPTDLADEILAAARWLFEHKIDLGGQGVRLLGVGVSGLSASRGVQASLFPDERDPRRRRLAEIGDELRARLGARALVRASVLRPTRRADGGDGEDETPEASSLPAVD